MIKDYGMAGFISITPKPTLMPIEKLDFDNKNIVEQMNEVHDTLNEIIQAVNRQEEVLLKLAEILDGRLGDDPDAGIYLFVRESLRR
jgi:hypothetical protein